MIDIGRSEGGICYVERYARLIRRLRKECDRTTTVGRQEFREVRDWLMNMNIKVAGEIGECPWEKLREVEVGVKDDAWFPESWRGDGAFVDGWKVEVRGWEDGRGYTLVMERMD